MKKSIILAGLFIELSQINAQTTASPSTNENYVYTKSYLKYPLPNDQNQNTKISENVEYFDGLGRTKQIVNVKSSPQEKDVVTHIVYDELGRQVREYLPVPQLNTLNGALVPDPLTNATQPAIYGSEKFYSEKIVDNSTLDRVLEQKQVGNAWNDKTVKFKYNANADSEVRKYVATFNYATFTSSIVLSVPYDANQLYKNRVTDEDGNQTIEFKNSQGQTLLVRKMLDETASADTYYVYNDYNQLAYVIPPLAVTADNLDETTLNIFCYQYKYDGKNRLVEKKLPNKGWEYMVYDKADRLIMTQDVNLQQQQQWLITKYDQFGRVAYTGVIQGGSRESMQIQAGGAVITESRNSTGFTKNGMQIYYSNGYFVDIHTLLSVNYYDSYPPGSPAMPTQVLGQDVLTHDAQNSRISTKGLPVATYIKNIEDDNWTKNYTWYDNKGRAVASHSINHLGGFTKKESELDFSGAVLQMLTRHKRLEVDTEKVITETFIYDHQNRLKVHKHKVDNNPEEILAQNSYNELSQLKNKKVGGTNLGSGIQSIDYQYNIRGWMTKINDPYNLGNSLFGYELKYTDPILTPGLSKKRYNGNISEVNWKTSNDEVLRRYQYMYDNLNRLTISTFTEPDADIPNRYLYNEDIRYDLNGNITELLRTGNQYSPTEVIDELYYIYSGNRAVGIHDASNNPSGYPGGGNPIAYDYNGNMTSIKDKGIYSINYNHQNLPNLINVSPGTIKASITNYTYRADGIKVSKSLTGFNASSITDYLDGFQYKFYQGQFTPSYPLGLQFIPTSEGYFDFTKNKYIYNYIDHLGNVRLSYLHNGSNVEVLEENNYYAFGLKHDGYNLLSGTNNYQYMYNGKELQETGMYDYGARFYMPDIGRWPTMDGKGELYLSKSPYSYANNTPVNAVDPDGNLVIFINGQHGGSGGSPEYWQGRFRGYMTVAGGHPMPMYDRFDVSISKHLGDYERKYVDGAMGGWMNTVFATENVNTSATNRINSGFTQGKKDASEIISNLARDESTGAIIETIKIITHSMGGAYGKGYVNALKEYISTLPKEQQKQIKITLVADFDPFQAGSLTADPNVKTQQFIHEGEDNAKGMGWLANEKEQGLNEKDIYINTGPSTDHSILTFFNDISKLQEGTYQWSGSSWDCTSCTR